MLNSLSNCDSRYFAVASNYEPTNAGLAAFVRDRLLDRVFKNAENDLIVPTAGVYEANGGSGFPIKARFVLPAVESVPHTAYFGTPAARSKILEWLAANAG